MKALITGATGLVGKHLVYHLKQSNYDIIALGRNENELNDLKALGISVLSFDLTNESEFEKLNDFNDYVWIHVAAAISGAIKVILDTVNVLGTQLLVHKAESIGVKRFVLISSISTYSIDLQGKIKADAPQNPESYYGKTKLEQERILKQSNLSFTIIRPPYIGGPYDTNVLEEFTNRIEKEKMPTFSKIGRISYVDARDLAHGIKLVIENEKTIGKSYNIISEVKTHNEVLELIASQVGKDKPYGPYYPFTFAMFVGVLGEIWAKLRRKSSERSTSRYRIKTLCRQFELSSDELEQDTGYKPDYTIEQSIKDWLPTRTTK